MRTYEKQVRVLIEMALTPSGLLLEILRYGTFYSPEAFSWCYIIETYDVEIYFYEDEVVSWSTSTDPM